MSVNIKRKSKKKIEKIGNFIDKNIVNVSLETFLRRILISIYVYWKLSVVKIWRVLRTSWTLLFSYQDIFGFINRDDNVILIR